MQKTVLELDLVGYSDETAKLQQSLGVKAVTQLNEQIQSLIQVGLDAVAATRECCLISTAGDNAILAFDSAEDAHRAAAAVHAACAEHNRLRPLSPRVFRSGAATGEVDIEKAESGKVQYAGSVIAHAVRLEAASNPGALLIDQATYDLLPLELQGGYSEIQQVAGKRAESYAARSCQFDSTLTIEPPPVVIDRCSLHQKLASIRGNQFDTLLFLLEVPIDQRPSEALNLEQRKSKLLAWGDESSNLSEIDAELSLLVKPSANPN